MLFQWETASLGDVAGDFFDSAKFHKARWPPATSKQPTQPWSKHEFQDCPRELWPHNISLLPLRTKLAWLRSSRNENRVTGIIPERQEQSGFTPFQPMRIFVRGPVSQTHTPFISLSSPTGAILWAKWRNSGQVSHSPCFPSAESF